MGPSHMQCARCGTLFDGRFCPACGTPSAPPAPAFAAPVTFQCGRCGTLYEGRFCPSCGLPARSPWLPPPGPPPAPAIFPLLNAAWALAIAGFLLVLAIATYGLVGSVAPMYDGIQEIRRGGTVDGGFDAGRGAWAFSAWNPGLATDVWVSAGGNPDGHLEMQLSDSVVGISSGFWHQEFPTDGSHPYFAAVSFEYRVAQVSPLLGNLTLEVYVQTDPGYPVGTPVWTHTLPPATTNWTAPAFTYPPTGETIDFIVVSPQVPVPGRYTVKVAALAWNTGGAGGTPTVVAIDNLELRWATYAFVDVVIVVPYPVVLLTTQDRLFFQMWTAGLVAAAALSLAVLAGRDGRPALAALRASSRHVPAKLRSRSALVAIAQTFLAVLFLNLVVALSTDPPTPSFFTVVPDWYLLFLLLNASVYEEIIFRLLLIGLPLVAGSLYFRLSSVVKGQNPPGASRGLYVLGAFRYFLGGGMSRRTPISTLLPATLLLVASSIVFGLAHLPGYGWWKVLPSTAAGLAMGYLFLRHGVWAAIVFHFATDMFVGAGYLVGLESDAGLAMNLLFLGLAIIGAGFFGYYFLYAFRAAKDALGPPEVPGAAPAAAVPVPPTWPPGIDLVVRGPAPVPAPVAPGLPPEYVPSTPPPAYGRSPIEYRCPRCNWVEAAYEAGRFRCARCGYES